MDGTTDSEACFALILTLIDPVSLAAGRVPPSEMQAATLGAIALLREFLANACAGGCRPHDLAALFRSPRPPGFGVAELAHVAPGH